ncbi:MAG: LolA family protein [Pyrinomonadaceae bacterium]
MKRNLFLSILFLTLLCFANVAAQSPDKILKQASRALGGEKNLRAIRSSQKSGKIMRLKDGAGGAFEMQSAAPNFYNERYDLNGFEIETGYNGKSGWRRDSLDGLRTLTGEASLDFAAEAVYRNSRWLDYKRNKSKIVASGKASVRGKSANSVILTTAKGVSIKMYFDAANGLLLREEIPGGDILKVFDYDDYQIVDGVQEAFLINEKIGEDAYEIRLEKANHNQPIVKDAFNFPVISGAPLPDIPQLLRELQANEDKVDEILENYSYTQKSIKREPGKDGGVRETDSETFQISYYKGRELRRLIEKNGKPLSESEQADEDKNVQKRVAEIEKQIAKKEAKAAQSPDGTPEDERISIAELLRASRLVNPRRERFRGRDVVVFDFEPNPDFDYKNAKSFLKFFGKTAGVMWIDERDKQVARLEAYLADNFKIGGGLVANLKRGASFALEQERVGDEVWLPSTADINLSVKVLLVKNINVNQIIKSYNYRKFKTEVKDAKVDEIKK